MAFEPKFEKVVTGTRKTLGSVQSQVECKFPAADEVKKIVCSNAKANITNVDVNGKEIVYSGFVNFQMIYLNGSYEPVSMDYTAEFKDRYQAEYDLKNSVATVDIAVIDVNTMLGNDIKVQAVLELKFDVIENNYITALVDVQGINYFVQKELFNYSNYVSMIKNQFELINDIEIKDGISKVLSVCPSVYIEKVVPSDRFLTLNGGVYFDITYLTDNNMIRTTSANFTFNQEIANDNLNENSIIQNCLQILYNDIKVTTSIDTNSAIVNINLPLLYNGYIFESGSLEIVRDLYSTDYFNKVVIESVKTLNNFSNIVFNDRLNGSITIQDNDAFIDELLGNCCSNVVIANSVITDSVLVVDGVATITVVYFNKETNNPYSVEVEMPFSVSTNIDLESGDVADIKVVLTNINTRARRGKEIEVNSNLEIYVDVFKTYESVVINKLEEDDELPEYECAMSFYITKDGDTLWSMAKELKISPEELQSQNPSLVEPVVPGMRVVIYRQRQVEF